MQKFTGTPIVPANVSSLDIKYTIIDDIKNYASNYPCIVVKSLDPDYYLLFSSISLIITEQGGPLSHLAILARDYNIPVIRIENITSQIAPQGILSMKDSVIEVRSWE